MFIREVFALKAPQTLLPGETCGEYGSEHKTCAELIFPLNPFGNCSGLYLYKMVASIFLSKASPP